MPHNPVLEHWPCLGTWWLQRKCDIFIFVLRIRGVHLKSLLQSFWSGSFHPEDRPYMSVLISLQVIMVYTMVNLLNTCFYWYSQGALRFNPIQQNYGNNNYRNELMMRDIPWRLWSFTMFYFYIHLSYKYSSTLNPYYTLYIKKYIWQ